MVNKPYQTVKDALVRLPCPFQVRVYLLTVPPTVGDWYCRAVHRGIHDSKPS